MGTVKQHSSHASQTRPSRQMSQQREESPGSDSDERVAQAALAISLVSLVVSLGQLLQAYFATSDGYRRCKEPALGPWARLTRTPFHPTELRYETIYSAPQIELSSVMDTADSASTLVKQRLHGPHHRVVQLPTVDNQRMLAMVSDGYSADTQPKVTNLGSLEQLRESQDAKAACSRTPDVENGQARLVMSLPKEPRRWLIFRSLSIRAKYDDFVLGALATTLMQRNGPGKPFLKMFHANPKSHATWIAFLREMSLSTAVPSNLPVSDLANVPCTDAVVQVAERSWDFTAGVMKPRAMTTVSTIVILAVRMNMDWYRLKAGQPGMEAFGNGFALTSTMDPDGHLFRFTCDDKFRHTVSDIVPSQNSDKMACGIIAATIIDEEIKLVNDEGELQQSDSIASALRLSEPARDCLRLAMGRTSGMQKAAANDLMMFLLPLVTIPGIDSYSVKFPGWLGFQNGNLHTVFNQRAYDVLYSRIGERSRHLSTVTEHGETLRLLLAEVKKLLRQGTEEEPKWASLDNCASDGERLSFLRNVHTAHNQATEALKSCRGFLLDLFDACIITTAEFISRRYAFTGLGDQKHVSDVLIQVLDSVASLDYGYMELLEEYLGEAFVEDMTKRVLKREHEFFGVHKPDIEAAWLILLVRGMLWHMSCRCLPLGKPIPSSTYYNSTRAWIE